MNTIGEIVAADHRAASVFREVGIDFCCGGKKTIEKACSEKNIDPESVRTKLRELELTKNDMTHNYNEWDPGFLADYIVNTHHRYVLKTLPELLAYTEKLSEVHGSRHPELQEVASLFSLVHDELLSHMKKEEEILFPAIKRKLRGDKNAGKIIADQMDELSDEHESAGGAMDRINEITNKYSVPADGCNTYRVAFRMLEEFEDDLHIHVHLENNILFPKSLKS